MESMGGIHVFSGVVSQESVNTSLHVDPVPVGSGSTSPPAIGAVGGNTEPVASDMTRIPGATVTISFCTGKLVPVFELDSDVIILQESVVDPVSVSGGTMIGDSTGGGETDVVSHGVIGISGSSGNHTSSFKGTSSGRVSVTISSVTTTWQFGDQIDHSIGLFFTEVA